MLLFFQSGLTINCQSNSFLSTYLDLPPTANLVVLWLYHACLSDWTYTSDAKLVGIWDSLKTLVWLDYLLLSESLSKAFIGCKILFFFFCIPVSDKKTYIWCNVSCNVWLCMNEMSEHLNFFFLNLFHSFSSSLVLTNAKCKCHVQMPWLVLPMRYATIVPQYAIDRLLTADLDVNANKM